MTEAYLGGWSIARSIVDFDRTDAIDCTGEATLQALDRSIVYAERVRFELANKLIHATRSYHFTTSDGAIVATFSDGAPFFTLRLDAGGIGRAFHQCGGDRYALTLELREPDRWQTCWDVSGTKRLRITSAYRRSRQS
jgi:hypothetical protein